jgi:very-short-patch-repair endonuclease
MKKLSTEEFINRAKKVHGNKYDYSKIEYFNHRTQVIIICPIHGEFKQLYYVHLRGCGCPKCAGFEKRKTMESFLTEAKKKHGDKYDYTKSVYINQRTKMIIICPKHGEFKQTPDSHLNQNAGCKRCGSIKSNFSKKKTINQFIKEAKIVHGDKYTYDINTSFKNVYETVKITCIKHGEFKQVAREHLRGCGCPKCKESYGERKITQFLEKNKLNYIPQKKFPKCKLINQLPFDFYLGDLNVCIEYNGKQHYEPIVYWGGEKHLEYVQKNDKIKKKFCKAEGIKLIVIKYTEDVEQKLTKELLIK